MSKTAHWTARSDEDFLYSVATDFIEKLREKMKPMGMTQSKLARAAKVHKSYISRIFKDPGNLQLDTIVKLARIVGLKVSLVSYDDGDTSNERGPIDAEVFVRCWKEQGSPSDMWGFEAKQTQTVSLSDFVLPFAMNYRGIHNQQSRKPSNAATDNSIAVIQNYDIRDFRTSVASLTGEPIWLK